MTTEGLGNIKRVWRITHRSHEKGIFTGEGARRFGGRFNSSGQSVIYTAGSLSLALLETLVRTNNRQHLSSCLFVYADIPGELVNDLNHNDLPDDWNALPYGASSQRVGDEWLAAGKSAVLSVPSVVVPFERNFLINPVHPEFDRIVWSAPSPVPVDDRLLK